MKVNHFICPTCGHDFYCDCAYARCDGCQTIFYVAQSKTSNFDKTEYDLPVVRYSAIPGVWW